MKNVYDIAHELCRSLKETDQYKNYERAKIKVDANPSVKKMIDDFHTQNAQLQTQMMLEGKQDADLMSKIQSLYSIVIQDPLAAEYLQAELSYSQVIAEVYQILGEAAKIA